MFISCLLFIPILGIFLIYIFIYKFFFNCNNLSSALKKNLVSKFINVNFLNFLFKFSFKDFFWTLIAIFIVYFSLKYPFLFMGKALNLPLWIHHIGCGICSCFTFFIAIQLKEGDTKITFVKILTIFIISLLSLVFFPSLVVIFSFFPELMYYLELYVINLLNYILEIITPIRTSYAQSPEPDSSNNVVSNQDSSNNRSRSRSPLHQTSGRYRERSPRMTPMSARVPATLSPTMGNIGQRPVDLGGIPLGMFQLAGDLSHVIVGGSGTRIPLIPIPNCESSPMTFGRDYPNTKLVQAGPIVGGNGAPVIPIAQGRLPDGSSIVCVAQTKYIVLALTEGPQVTEGAMAGRTVEGYLPGHHLFDSDSIKHKYNQAETWYNSEIVEGEFSSDQKSYHTHLMLSIEKSLITTFNRKSTVANLAARRLASYHFKKKYEENADFLS